VGVFSDRLDENAVAKDCPSNDLHSASPPPFHFRGLLPSPTRRLRTLEKPRIPPSTECTPAATGSIPTDARSPPPDSSPSQAAKPSPKVRPPVAFPLDFFVTRFQGLNPFCYVGAPTWCHPEQEMPGFAGNQNFPDDRLRVSDRPPKWLSVGVQATLTAPPRVNARFGSGVYEIFFSIPS